MRERERKGGIKYLNSEFNCNSRIHEVEIHSVLYTFEVRETETVSL